MCYKETESRALAALSGGGPRTGRDVTGGPSGGRAQRTRSTCDFFENLTPWHKYVLALYQRT